MDKCEVKRCRNNAELTHYKYGKICWDCWEQKCKTEEQAWMEKQWNKTLNFVGVTK